MPLEWNSIRSNISATTAHALIHCLDQAGLDVRLVDLAAGQDPNSYFADGGDAQHFVHLPRGQLQVVSIL